MEEQHYDYGFKEGGGQARPKTVMQKGITVGGEGGGGSGRL